MITIDTDVQERPLYTTIIDYLIEKGLQPVIDYSVFIPIYQQNRTVYFIHFNSPEAEVIETFLTMKYL